jgi:hypothetical protein
MGGYSSDAATQPSDFSQVPIFELEVSGDFHVHRALNISWERLKPLGRPWRDLISHCDIIKCCFSA